MNEFHFLRPEFLWLLLPALTSLTVGIFSINREVKWKNIIAPHLRPFMIKEGNESLKIRMQIALTLFLSSGIIGLAGPTWEKVQVPGKLLETPVVIALDLSQSMMTTDLEPNRLERAKFKIIDFLKANPRARVALVGYSGTAHQIVPLTKDYEIIKSHLEGLSPQTLPYPGTDVSNALTLSDSIMSVTDAPGVLVWITDDLNVDNFTWIQNYIQQGNKSVEIIPVGTSFGGKVPGVGKNIHSQLDTLMIARFSAMDRVQTRVLTLDDSDVKQLAKKISTQVEFQDKDEELEDQWKDKGLLFILPLLVFVLFWFRKGMVIYGLLIIITLSSCDNSNLWYTKDYQGQKFYDNKEYLKAANVFENELHKGVAYFKAGKYDQAIQAFSQDTTAMGSYNLGLAYFKNGDLAAAQLAFGRASEIDPTMSEAIENQNELEQNRGGNVQVSKQDAQEAQKQPKEKLAQGMENKSSEDLGGGGQEATEKQMETNRLEETVNTDMRRGKELDEVPDELQTSKPNAGPKILMQAVDDDPSLFLKKKFKYQAKKEKLKPKKTDKKW
ncbi:VWA domain-containing protein [Flavobacteriaceae bacterium]|nr:VWA domain-containing protein [Flavobacteriaceae bacterium]